MSICKVCGKECQGKVGLGVHMRKSHPGYEKCRLCGDFYMNLDRHQIEEHDMTEKCPVCGMRFESSWGLRPHYQQKNDHPNESIPEIREKDVPQMNE